jgi:hypothetical protein
LRRLVEQQVETASELSTRLQAVQLPPDPTTLGDSDSNSSGGTQRPEDLEPRPNHPQNPKHPAGKITVHEKISLMQKPFEVVLSKSRVYDRVKDREVDGRMSILTTRSHAWSVLSDLSLAAISVVMVLNLPLSDRLQPNWQGAILGPVRRGFLFIRVNTI